MKIGLNLLKWFLTLGKESQNFLGAKWIRAFLKRVPEKKKRTWALRILSLSPHYFIFPDAPEYHGMSNDEYLDAAFLAVSESRNNIFDLVLKAHVDRVDKLIDYGCGPGFLAKAASNHVKAIYGLDISSGAIACAAILNPADNVEYLVADEAGLAQIPDESIDAIYSYAVAQHLTDEIFELVLENCRSKLKPGGKLLIHTQLNDNVWQTEEDWRKNSTLRGKIKFNYGLHCFGRTEKQYFDVVEKHGFGQIRMAALDGFAPQYDDELKSQRLLIAQRIR